MGLPCPLNSLLKCQGQGRLNPEGQYGKFYNFLQMLSVCKVKVMLIIPFWTILFYVVDGHSPAADAEDNITKAVNGCVVAFRGGYRARRWDATGRLLWITYTRCYKRGSPALFQRSHRAKWWTDDPWTEVAQPHHPIDHPCASGAYLTYTGSSCGLRFASKFNQKLQMCSLNRKKTL